MGSGWKNLAPVPKCFFSKETRPLGTRLNPDGKDGQLHRKQMSAL